MAFSVELAGLFVKHAALARSAFNESFRVVLRPNRPQSRSEQLAANKAAEDEVFFREVDEAVRQDQMAWAAKRFGIPLLAAILIGLAGFGGWLWWQSESEEDLEQRSEEMVRALDHLSADNLDTASKALDPVIADGSDGAATAARLLRAGIALQQGRRAEAVKLYAEVAADKAAPQPYRDLATIREIATNFDVMPPAKVVERLKPLAVPGNPWFGSAGELVGIAYLKQGKPDLAGPLFAAIAKDEKVPQTLRARSRQIAGLLGVDAIVDVDEIVKAASDGMDAPAQQD